MKPSPSNYGLALCVTILIGLSNVLSAQPCAAPTATATPATVCAGGTSTLVASGSSGTYLWYNSPTSTISIWTGAVYNTLPLFSTTTFYVQTFSLSGFCFSPRTPVTVIVIPLPAAPAASATPSTICAGSSTTITASGSTGVYEWYTSIIGGTAIAVGSSFITPNLSSTTTYYVQTTVNGCSSSRTGVTVNVTPTPAILFAFTLPRVICAGGTATLTATPPLGGTINWYDAQTGGNFIGSGAIIGTPVLMTTTTFWAEPVVNSCPGPRRAVTVSVNPGATPPTVVASPATVCGGRSSVLNVTGPGGTYQWFASPNSIIPIWTGPSYATLPLFTTTTYYVQTTQSRCTSARTAVTVTVNPLPPAPTASASPAALCSGGTSTLTATAPGGTYEWFKSAIGGSPVATGSTFTTPTLTGTTIYFVQATVNGCPGPRTSVTVSVLPAPSAPRVQATPSTVCYGGTSVLAAATINSPINWYDTQTGGNLLGTGPTYTTAPLTATTTFWVERVQGLCASARVAVTVNVQGQIPPPVAGASPPTVCYGGTTILASTAQGTVYWYDAPAGGNLVGSGFGVTTIPLYANTTFYAEARVGNCSSARSAVDVTVSEIIMTSSIHNENCGHADGEINSIVTGGTTPYDFLWSNYAVDRDILDLVAGTYTVTITDQQGCVQVEQRVVGENLLPGCEHVDQSAFQTFGKCAFSIERMNEVNAQRNSGQRGGSPIVLPCGKFNLSFFENNGIGFDDPVNGATRRNCACNVFQYIESVINIPPSTPTIEIQFLASANDPNADWLAQAYPYFPNAYYTDPGYYGGDVYNKIVHGQDLDPYLYDANIQVNFGFDYIDCSSSFNACEYDLYSVLLHEITHTMGWFSLLIEHPATGVALSGGPGGHGQLSVYDQKFLWWQDMFAYTPPQKIVTGGGTIMQDPWILSTGNVWMHGTGMYFDHPVFSKNNILKYFGLFATFKSGQYLSHYDGALASFSDRGFMAPGQTPNYVMSYLIPQNAFKNQYTLEEFRSLEELGYTLKPSFLAATTINGTDPNSTIINSNSPPYTTKNFMGRYEYDFTYPELKPADVNKINDGTPVIINLRNDARILDPDGDVVSVMPGSLINIRGCGDGGNNHNALTVNLDGTKVSYEPRTDFIGRAQFGFHLWDGKERGAFMIYTIDVFPGLNFNNGANLVVNGSFEAGAEVALLSNPGVQNSSWLNDIEGRYLCGAFFADAHMYNYLNSFGFPAHGDNIRESFRRCDVPGIGTFGTPGNSFLPGGAANAASNGGNRYENLKNDVALYRLAKDMEKCKRYEISLDINFDTDHPVTSSSYTMLAGFLDIPVFQPTSHNYSFPWTVNVPPSGTGWTHIQKTFDYCGNLNSDFLNLQGTSDLVYIDNLSIIELPDPPAMTVDLGPDVANCSGHGVPLHSTLTNAQCTVNYQWTPPTGLNCTNCPNPVAHPTTPVTYTLIATEVCDGDIATDNITVSIATGTPPNANFTTNAVCLDVDFIPAQTQNLHHWDFGDQLGTSNIAPPSYPYASGGTYTVTHTVTNQCYTDIKTLDVTTYDPPSAYAGYDDFSCIPQYTLRPVPSFGTGTWTVQSKPPGAPTPTFSQYNPNQVHITSGWWGCYTFRWTEVNGTCPPSFDDVVICFDPNVSANAGPDGHVCGTAYVLQAVPVFGTGGTGTWTVQSKPAGAPNPTFSDTHDPHAEVTINPNFYGCYTFRWREVSSGSCPPEIDEVVVCFVPAVSADAGPDVCPPGVTLGGIPTTAIGGTGPFDYLWNPSSGIDNRFAEHPVVTTGTSTNYTVTVTDDNGCTATDDVFVGGGPIIGGGTSQDEGRAIAVDANDNVYVGGIFQSTTAMFNGTPLTKGGTSDNNGYFAKYDECGQLLWYDQLHASSNSIGPPDNAVEVTSVALGSNGGSLVGGSFKGDMTAEYSQTHLACWRQTGNDLWCGYVLIYDATNNLVSNIIIDNVVSIEVQDVVQDPVTHEIWVAALINQQASWLIKYVEAVPTVYVPTNYLLASDKTITAIDLNSSGDVYLVGDDPVNNQSFLWKFNKATETFSTLVTVTTSGAAAAGLVIDQTDNTVFLAGNFAGTSLINLWTNTFGTMTFTPVITGATMYIAKYDIGDDEIKWVEDAPIIASAIDLNEVGRPVVTGTFTNDMAFAGNIINAGQGDAIALCWGKFVGGHAWGANVAGGNANDQGLDIAIHPTNGNIYVTGSFESTATFGTQGQKSTQGVGGDLFITRGNNGSFKETESSLQEISGDDWQVSVYPNPTDGNLLVHFHDCIEGEGNKANIRVYSIYGQLIESTDIICNNGIKHELNLKDYAKGIYLLKVQSGNKIHTEKIILQ